MKREGLQHGTTVRINRSNKLLRVAAADCDDETAVGAAMEEHGKAPAVKKPTNASKATGKCRRPRCGSCHHHPVSKARDKTKGAHKLHAGDVALNHRLVSWRVVDGGGAGAGSSGIPANYKGTSASSLLAYLAGGSSWHEDDDDDDGGSPETAPLVNDLYDIIVGRRADVATDIAVGDTDAIEEQEERDSDDVKEEEDGDEAEEDDDMGFCMVGVTIAVEFSDGEEDWIVVEEIV